jgi:pimeloyl-ACP methyl ester carboxylesterase
VTVTDTFIDTPRGRLFLRAWGEPRTWSALPPIVLLHESLGSVDVWRDFPYRLAAATGHPVIAYDRLGFGRSDPYPGALDVSGFVRDEARTSLPALRSRLGIHRMVLFGHSTGGTMALVAAAEMGPATVTGVITEAAQIFLEAQTVAGVRTAKETFAAPDQFDRLVRHHGTKARWVLDAWTDTWLSPAVANWTIEDDLRRVRCPVLALHGNRDEYGTRAHPDRIAALVPQADIVLLDDCGHVPHREHADAVVAHVRRFIRERIGGWDSWPGPGGR